MFGSPVTPRAERVVGDERTRRAGLRRADVAIRGVDERCAPKRRALKHNAQEVYAQLAFGQLSVRAHARTV